MNQYSKYLSLLLFLQAQLTSASNLRGLAFKVASGGEASESGSNPDGDIHSTTLGPEQEAILELVSRSFGSSCHEIDDYTPDLPFLRRFDCYREEVISDTEINLTHHAVITTIGNVQLDIGISGLDNQMMHTGVCSLNLNIGFSFEECTSRLTNFLEFAPTVAPTPSPSIAPSIAPSQSPSQAPTSGCYIEFNPITCGTQYEVTNADLCGTDESTGAAKTCQIANTCRICDGNIAEILDQIVKIVVPGGEAAGGVVALGGGGGGGEEAQLP